MKTLKRILLALPLLLTLTAAVGSCFSALAFGAGRGQQTLDLLISRCQIHVAYKNDAPSHGDMLYFRVAPNSIGRLMRRWNPAPLKREREWLGVRLLVFDDYVAPKGQPNTFYHLVLPFWIIGLISSLPILLIVWRLARCRQRIREGLCGHCGYDLRHTTDRCPECGQAVPSTALP